MKKEVPDDEKQKATATDEPIGSKEIYKKLNVFQKLNILRKMVCSSSLKKGGKNVYSNYQYFELDDFIPRVLNLCDEIGLTAMVTPGEIEWFLTLTNSDDMSQVLRFNFISKSADMEMKGSTKIQVEGARTTYIRRYLWILALELTESDGIDGLSGKDPDDGKNKTTPKKDGEPAGSKKTEPDGDKKTEPDGDKKTEPRKITDEGRQVILRKIHAHIGGEKSEAIRAYREELKKFGGDEISFSSGITGDNFAVYFDKYIATKDDDIPEM